MINNCCTFNGLTERFLFQVLPRSRKDDGEDKDEEWWSSALGDGKTVVSIVHSICKSAILQICKSGLLSFQILYLHGNTSHRAGRRRKQLYEVRLK